LKASTGDEGHRRQTEPESFRDGGGDVLLSYQEDVMANPKQQQQQQRQGGPRRQNEGGERREAPGEQNRPARESEDPMKRGQSREIDPPEELDESETRGSELEDEGDVD
jgi:hypothetical protein